MVGLGVREFSDCGRRAGLGRVPQPMPPRPSLPSPAGSFYPPNDSATHRDLLLFEERLKMNAAVLHRRKRRYQRA